MRHNLSIFALLVAIYCYNFALPSEDCESCGSNNDEENSSGESSNPQDEDVDVESASVEDYNDDDDVDLEANNIEIEYVDLPENPSSSHNMTDSSNGTQITPTISNSSQEGFELMIHAGTAVAPYRNDYIDESSEALDFPIYTDEVHSFYQSFSSILSYGEDDDSDVVISKRRVLRYMFDYHQKELCWAHKIGFIFYEFGRYECVKGKFRLLWCIYGSTTISIRDAEAKIFERGYRFTSHSLDPFFCSQLAKEYLPNYEHGDKSYLTTYGHSLCTSKITKRRVKLRKHAKRTRASNSSIPNNYFYLRWLNVSAGRGKHTVATRRYLKRKYINPKRAIYYNYKLFECNVKEAYESRIKKAKTMTLKGCLLDDNYSSTMTVRSDYIYKYRRREPSRYSSNYCYDYGRLRNWIKNFKRVYIGRNISLIYGYVRIKSFELYLDSMDEEQKSRKYLITSHKKSTLSQIWYIEKADSNGIIIKSAEEPQKVVNIEDGCCHQGGNVITWPFNGGESNEKFKFDNGLIRSAENEDMVLTVNILKDKSKWKNSVITWNNIKLDSQYWYIIDARAEYLALKNIKIIYGPVRIKQNGKFLDKLSRYLYLRERNSSLSQIWIVQKTEDNQDLRIKSADDTYYKVLTVRRCKRGGELMTRRYYGGRSIEKFVFENGMIKSKCNEDEMVLTVNNGRNHRDSDNSIILTEGEGLDVQTWSFVDAKEEYERLTRPKYKSQFPETTKEVQDFHMHILCNVKIDGRKINVKYLKYNHGVYKCEDGNLIFRYCIFGHIPVKSEIEIKDFGYGIEFCQRQAESYLSQLSDIVVLDYTERRFCGCPAGYTCDKSDSNSAVMYDNIRNRYLRCDGEKSTLAGCLFDDAFASHASVNATMFGSCSDDDRTICSKFKQRVNW